MSSFIVKEKDDALKPCPFCGGEAEIHHDIYMMDRYSVQCGNCHAGIFGWWSEKEEAAYHWNRRVEG